MSTSQLQTPPISGQDDGTLPVDLQVNGYAGIDFNADSLTLEEVHAVCRQLESDGVGAILATVITDQLPQMSARLAKLAGWIDSDPLVAAMIAGLHIEGPFISPVEGYVGAHPADAVRRAEMGAVEQLLEAAGGHARLVTLAPEMDDDARVTAELRSRGITVAAGHSNASLDQLRRAIDAGLQLFTHLGNGCPGLLHRHDNIIQRVLSLSEQLYVSFIADGHHIPAPALSNYLRRVPDEHIIIVSDAMLAAGLGPGRFQFANQTVEVDEAGAAWSADRTHFAGSAATLKRMREVLQTQLGIGSEAFDRWTITNPRRLLGS
ncbi:N-acetylglucosamine-6-phosphate deacetylase [Candidatus Laterigemmans baculatus]|uniref:N-acetylglucosamine-6-phosphate deacetylase n=1 Tax=Candidatus Laterigemmans baculatus TaxID=2770505 RepID=UPI00193BB122|nr:N-acetylglucosamine-6-phosphate deacetylase [Candidatus Laterigemmans baculatus]